MSFAWQCMESFVLACAIIWLVGSLVFPACRPWNHFEPEDRWIVWVLLFGWPFVALAMFIELGLEWRLDRRDRRVGHG